ncbi:hypothetical protein H633G_11031 [Metarhizium anisopliae BRIP 53284]|nr:hypothetical protein H633G_11031 [Metarhizium anisopliae BRIP 53284]
MGDKKPLNKAFKHMYISILIVYLAIENTIYRVRRKNLNSFAAMEALHSDWSDAFRTIHLSCHRQASITPTLVNTNYGIKGIFRSSLDEIVSQILVALFGNNLGNSAGPVPSFHLSTDYEQAVDDIERQLQGVGFAKPSVDRAIRPQGPAQKLLVGALTTPLDDTLQGQYRRRDNTIGAIVAYCGVEEGLTVRRTHALPTTSAPHENPREHSEDSPLFLATLSVFIDNPKQRPRRCFLCIGSAHSLPPEDPRIEDKISEFYTPGDLSKHFRRRHLSKLQDNDQPVCQVCDMTLAHKMHLQKHSISVHGTIS